MNCKNCGASLVWVPDRGGKWVHYRASHTCGKPEAAPEEPRYLETLDADERGGR